MPTPNERGYTDISRQKIVFQDSWNLLSGTTKDGYTYKCTGTHGNICQLWFLDRHISNLSSVIIAQDKIRQLRLFA